MYAGAVTHQEACRTYLSSKIGNAITSQGNTAGISEYWPIPEVWVDDFAERRRRFWPQWTETLFVPFAIQPNLSRTFEAEFPEMNGQGLADPRAGIVKEEKKRPITHSERRLRVHCCYDRARLLGFKICSSSESSSLGREREDPAVLFGPSQVVPQQMPCKTPQHGQAVVSRRGRITPARFHIVQKGKHGICPEIIQRQICCGSSASLSQEQEKEPERVAVSTDRVAARATYASR